MKESEMWNDFIRRHWKCLLGRSVHACEKKSEFTPAEEVAVAAMALEPCRCDCTVVACVEGGNGCVVDTRGSSSDFFSSNCDEWHECMTRRRCTIHGY